MSAVRTSISCGNHAVIGFAQRVRIHGLHHCVDGDEVAVRSRGVLGCNAYATVVSVKVTTCGDVLPVLNVATEWKRGADCWPVLTCRELCPVWQRRARRDLPWLEA